MTHYENRPNSNSIQSPFTPRDTISSDSGKVVIITDKKSSELSSGEVSRNTASMIKYNKDEIDYNEIKIDYQVGTGGKKLLNEKSGKNYKMIQKF